MSNKTIKNIFNEKIDKKEIYNNVLNKSNKNNHLLIVSIVTATIIIFCLIISINSDIYTKYSHVKTVHDESSININQVENIDIEYSTSSNEGLYTFDIEYKNENNVNTSYSKKESYTIQDIEIPSDLILVTDKKIDNYNNIKNNTIYEIEYKNKTNSRKLKIIYSEFSEIIDDYQSSNPSKSKINNTEITLLKYENTYRALFEYKNKYYRIESFDITEEEFITLIKSIIKE